MIRLLISVALALVVTTSAGAMSPVPLHEPDPMITKVRKAGQCDDPNQVVVNGICEDYARDVSRAEHKCIAWNEGFCIEYYGTLKPCGPEVRC